MAVPTARETLYLAPPDLLKREVQSVLTHELADSRSRVGHGRYDGFAYVAAQAYFNLAGGYSAGLQPAQLRRNGRLHWWLVDFGERIIDLTLGPGETTDFPYE